MFHLQSRLSFCETKPAPGETANSHDTSVADQDPRGLLTELPRTILTERIVFQGQTRYSQSILRARG